MAAGQSVPVPGYTHCVVGTDHRPEPRMHLVQQRFGASELRGFDKRLAAEVKTTLGDQGVGPGARIAIAVGSRGVSPIRQVVRIVIDIVRSLGAEPFVVPAMGSHGGATAEGQLAVLAGYGITEEGVGAPIRATMDTILIGEMEDGTPVHMDRHAHEADGVVLINRINCLLYTSDAADE